MAMPLTLPEIPEAENTPLVGQLLEIIRTQQDRIQQLEDEIFRLKGLKTRPVIAPSPLERPPRPPREPGQKRPGSAKRSKTAQLVITHEVVVPLADVPPGSAFKGYEDFVVQDLEIRPRVTRYRRERWRSPDGRNLVAPLPEGVRPESHFGSTLISFIIYQYHYQHVTQPLLLEQLDHLGIDISAGQLNGILTEKKDSFHDEKTEVLLAGLEVSSYVQVDDTGARHQGHNGFCTHIGNELFAYFESTDSKSRQNFLEVLRGPDTDYTINDAAVAYWQRQELAQAVIERLDQGCVLVRRRGGLESVPGLARGDPRAARANRDRRGVAGELDRARGVAGDGGPQRWGRAVRRLCACVVLAPRGASAGATGAA